MKCPYCKGFKVKREMEQYGWFKQTMLYGFTGGFFGTIFGGNRIINICKICGYKWKTKR